MTTKSDFIRKRLLRVAIDVVSAAQELDVEALELVANSLDLITVELRRVQPKAFALDEKEPSQYEAPGSSGNGGTHVDGYAPPPEPTRPPGDGAEVLASLMN